MGRRDRADSLGMGTWFSVGIAIIVAVPLLGLGLLVERLARES
jgi:hypothetical protein